MKLLLPVFIGVINSFTVHGTLTGPNPNGSGEFRVAAKAIVTLADAFPTSIGLRVAESSRITAGWIWPSEQEPRPTPSFVEADGIRCKCFSHTARIILNN